MTDPQDADRSLFQKFVNAMERDPDNTDLMVKFNIKFATKFPDEVVDVLKRRTLRSPPPADSKLLTELQFLACAAELQQRKHHGLPINYALGVDDLNFKYARGELSAYRQTAERVAQKTHALPAYVAAAQAHIASGETPQAEAIFAQIRSKLGALKKLPCAISFDPAFHDQLPQSEAARALPNVTWLRPIPAGVRKVLLVSGDYKYFQKYGRLLVNSFRAQRHPSVTLVMHVMDMTDAEGAALSLEFEQVREAHLSLSTEWTGLRSDEISDAARGYYHAIRFVRFAELLEQRADVAAWMLDMDFLFNGTPERLFEVLEGFDAALAFAPARLEVRNKVVANTVGIAASEAGRAFIRRVANYLAEFHRQDMLPWGIDQVALYAVANVLASRNALPRLTPVTPSVYGHDLCGDEQTLWGSKLERDSPDFARVRDAIRKWS